MERQNFKNVRLIIGGPSREVRMGLKSVLSAEGFEHGNMQDTDKVSGVRDAIVNNYADLVVCDAHLSDGDFDNLIHQVRHHELGNNPFVNVITFISTADKKKISKSINSGTDVILVKPISPGKVVERVENMIDERKPFVVTTDYIGPNRHTKHRPGTQKIPLIKVPNPLKAKVRGEPDEGKLRAEIDAMAKVLNEQKIERHAYQIVYLVERLVPTYAEGPVDDSAVADFDRLLAVSNDINRRVAGSSFADWKENCQALVNVVGHIRETPITPNEEDLKNLWNLAEIFKFQSCSAERAAKVAR